MKNSPAPFYVRVLRTTPIDCNHLPLWGYIKVRQVFLRWLNYEFEIVPYLCYWQFWAFLVLLELWQCIVLNCIPYFVVRRKFLKILALFRDLKTNKSATKYTIQLSSCPAAPSGLHFWVSLANLLQVHFGMVFLAIISALTTSDFLIWQKMKWINGHSFFRMLKSPK